MKIFTENKIIKKILIVFVLIVVLFQSVLFPVKSSAFGESLLSDLVIPGFKDISKGVAQVLAAFGDIFMGMFNNFMLGTSGFSTAMISNQALGNGSWFDPVDENGNTVSGETGVIVSDGDFEIRKEDYTYTDTSGKEQKSQKIILRINEDTIDDSQLPLGSDTWEIPNMLYCPENIFANNIAMLDVNFLNPNTYEKVVDNDGGKNESIAVSLKETIKSWYRTFRNVAIVALLSVLVYLGIRIVISSSVEDKAKHKQALQDWIIALCLVFIMHFIMSGIIMIVNQINSLFSRLNGEIYIQYGTAATSPIFRTNFTGVIRFLAQYNEAGSAWAYTLIYWVLIFYTITFTVQYFKRVLYIAFYTMIAPLVAITYPLDKIGDGKSQAFNKWLKEYIMTMSLQPIHLIIYSAIVGSTITLSIENPILAIIAIGFLIPAEKFIKSLFGVESQADGGFGSFASGALAMQGLNKLASIAGKGKSGVEKESKETEKTENNNKIRKVKAEDFAGFPGGGSSESELPNTRDEEESTSPRTTNVTPESATGTPENSTGDAGTPKMRFDGNGGFEPNTEGEATGGTQTVGTPANVRTTKTPSVSTKSNAKSANNARDLYKRARSNRGKKNIIKGAKKVYKGSKFIGKKFAKVAGGAMGGAIGVAAAIAGGKGIDGVISGAFAGAATGGALGSGAISKAQNLVEKPFQAPSKMKELVNKSREEKIEDAKLAGDKDLQRKLEKKQMMSQNKSKYNEYIKDYATKTGQTFTKEEKKSLREKLYDYDSRGISDKEKIFKGLEMEKEFEGKYSHDDIVNVMALSNNYGREAIIDEKQRKIFDNDLEQYYGLNEAQKESVKELFYKANDFDYAKQQRLERQKAQQARTQQEKQQAQAREKEREQTTKSNMEKINKQKKTREENKTRQNNWNKKEESAPWMENGKTKF